MRAFPQAYATKTFCSFALSPPTLVVLVILANHSARAEELAENSWKAPQVIVLGKRVIEEVKTSGDTAVLLENKPGVSFYTSGGASKLPVLRGLNDDRIKLLIDGAQTTSACANHMNPSLSYIDASQVKTIDVIAGITSVSIGGDSIAGTIILDSASPVYASVDGPLHEEAALGIFYKSVSHGVGIAASAAVADAHFSLGYSGSVDRAKSYQDGHGNKVVDTLYKTENHALTFGAQDENQALTVKLGYQYIPYQGYVNQYMDMVGNLSNSINVHYTRDLTWGKLDSRLYWQDAHHEMGFFTDEKTGSMPMNTHGKDIGYSIKGDITLSNNHTLRIGHDYHRFTLDDWWPAVAGSIMMGPLDYININDGKRELFGLFVESEKQWSPKWTSLLGIRTDLVRADTSNVQAYNMQDPIPMGMGGMGMSNPDAPAAAAFNASNRFRSDTNIDLTALARYTSSTTSTYDFGYARKTRSPNLYERYSWGRGTMASTMIGWFGDANGYVGNIDLKPEVAHTFSGTLNWHDAEHKNWELKATPYFTYIENYIDVDQIGTLHPLMAMQVSLPQLQFTNHDARLYGIDLSSQTALWNSEKIGRGVLKGTLSYTHAERTDTEKSLYHIMPLNSRASIEQVVGAWTNTAEIHLVDGKSRVDPLRQEQKTAGYALINLRTSYRWQNLRINLGLSNLFDRFYYQPLGGVNYAAWKAEGAVGRLGNVPGPGRSLDVGATLKF